MDGAVYMLIIRSSNYKLCIMRLAIELTKYSTTTICLCLAIILYLRP